MWRAKPEWARRFTCSSTTWMLTGSRSIGRSSVNTSMRSTSFTIRSASSQISRVKVRSSSPTDCSSSCAAPRMPDSGFLISCASMAASAVTERAAPRWVSWRSILSAMVRSCSITTTWSGRSGSGATCRSTSRSPGLRGVPRSTLYSLTGGAARAHLLDQRQQRAAERHQILRAYGGAAAAARPRRRIPPPHWRWRSARRPRP